MATDNSIFLFALLGIGTFGIAYAFIPEFRKQLNGVFGSFGAGGATTTGSCEELCARRECSTYLNKCGNRACPNCTSCAKLCSAGQCATYKTAGCKGICNNCGPPPSQQVSANCRYVTDPKNGARYTIWKGTGCSGGYLRNGLEAAVSGTNCAGARAAFVKAYACPSKYAHAFQAAPFENVTVA